MSATFKPLLICATSMLIGLSVQGEEVPSQAVEAPTLVLLPEKAVHEQAFGAGCWVHLFDGVDYAGERLTLVGPMALEDMRRTGRPWRDWDSMKVGPKAVVTIYIVADFGLPVATFKAGQQVADLTPITGRFEDINSVKVACDP